MANVRNLKFAELHTPLFLAGANLGLKLDVDRREGLILQYNLDNKELEVLWNNQTGYIPSSNIASMHEGQAKRQKPAPVHVHHPVQAQASSPQAHVFEGPGKGKR